MGNDVAERARSHAIYDETSTTHIQNMRKLKQRINILLPQELSSYSP